MKRAGVVSLGLIAVVGCSSQPVPVRHGDEPPKQSPASPEQSGTLRQVGQDYRAVSYAHHDGLSVWIDSINAEDDGVTCAFCLRRDGPTTMRFKLTGVAGVTFSDRTGQQVGREHLHSFRIDAARLARGEVLRTDIHLAPPPAADCIRIRFVYEELTTKPCILPKPNRA